MFKIFIGKHYSFLLISLSLIALILFWWVLSLFFRPEFLPSPILVFKGACSIFVSGLFLSHMYYTLLRIVSGFVLSMLISLVLGIAMGRSKYVEKFFEAEILVGLTIPALAWAVISIMWFGLKDFAAIFAITVLITPVITLNVVQGMKNLDKSLIEMAKTFEAKRTLVIRTIIIPQLLPYLFAATRFGLGLAWKTVVIVEMLGLSNGIGYMVAFWFGMFSMKDVLAWTLSFTLVMLVIEYGLLGRLEKWATRWRPVISF
ncbi:MAG: ABC transporter permease [bacterium]